MKREIEIFECEMVPDPTPHNPGQMKPVTKEMKGARKQVSEVGVDEALTKAKKIVKEMKLSYRSINMTTNGNIRVVVMKSNARGTRVPGGMVYKRPASS